MKKNITIPNLTLEQYVLGELPDRIRIEIEEIISRDNILQQKIETIRQSNDELLAQLPSNPMVQEIKLKAHANEVAIMISKQNNAQSWWKIEWNKYTVATVFTLLLVTGLSPFIVANFFNTEILDQTRTKGLSPQITVYRSIKDSSERLSNSSRVNTGDIIQIGYIAAGKKFGAIVSIDGRGTFTMHYPSSDTASTLLKNGGEILLENSYELDDAPLFENFFFITSDEPIVMEIVRNACHTLVSELKNDNSGILPGLPAQWMQYPFVLRKGTL